MATIIQRKKKFAVIYYYRDGENQRQQKWETYETKTEAKSRKGFIEFYQQEHGLVLVPLAAQFAAEIVHAKEGLKSREEDILLKDFLDIYVSIYGTSKWSESTYSGKVGAINNYIKPIIGDWKLSEVSTKRLSQYYNDLLKVPEVPKANRLPSGRCVQPASIKKIHDIIRSALNQAISWEYLDTKQQNPAINATLPIYNQKVRKVWSIETFEKALKEVDDELLELCMHLAFACSMRIGEISGILLENVFVSDEDIRQRRSRIVIDKELARVSLEALQKLNNRDIIRIFPTQKPHATTRLVLKTPKTKTSNRIAWLPETLARMIQKYIKRMNEVKEILGDGYNDYGLLISLDNGNPVESRIIRNRFQTLYEQMDFEEVDFHSLRHLSTGYKLKMTGGDIKSVQGDTGHAEADMVLDVYSRIIDEDRMKNAEKLDREFYSKATYQPASTVDVSTIDEKALLDMINKMPPEQILQLLIK